MKHITHEDDIVCPVCGGEVRILGEFMCCCGQCCMRLPLYGGFSYNTVGYDDAVKAAKAIFKCLVPRDKDEMYNALEYYRIREKEEQQHKKERTEKYGL